MTAYLDSIIMHFFSLNHLETYNKQTSDYIVMPINLEQENLSIKIFLDKTNHNISLIQCTGNDFNLSLFNLEFLSVCPNPNELFKFNYPNAFILDLRD